MTKQKKVEIVVIIILIGVFLWLLQSCSCGESQPDASLEFKYNPGDVVYIKPDSIKAVIDTKFSSDGKPKYGVLYYDNSKSRNSMNVDEYEIY